MADPLRLDTARRAQHLAEAVRRGATGIDVRAAPGLATDLVRVSSLVALSLAELARADRPHPHHSATARKLLLAALTGLEELHTLLSIAVSLEQLGARGARLEREVRELRLRLRDLRRRSPGDRGNAA